MGYKGSKGVFGNSPHRCYDLIYKLEKEMGKSFSVLIPDCYDGYCVMPMAIRNKTVDCFETNHILLDGGIIDGYNTIGLRKKIANANVKQNVTIINENFYTKRIEKQYDYVYCYRSLHLNRNMDIRMNVKIRKLLSSVKTGGYIYILYYLAKDSSDYINYPSNQYLREHDIKKYFDLNRWDIIFNIENYKRLHGPHPFNKKKHYHITGVLLAKKRNIRKKQLYRYSYTIH